MLQLISVACRAMTSDNGIEVEGLVREFKGGVRAVDGIHFDVRPGEIYGFLGPNGAGKSTTLRILTTLSAPISGTARVAGFDVTREPREVRRRIGCVAQSSGVDGTLLFYGGRGCGPSQLDTSPAATQNCPANPPFALGPPSPLPSLRGCVAT